MIWRQVTLVCATRDGSQGEREGRALPVAH